MLVFNQTLREEIVGIVDLTELRDLVDNLVSSAQKLQDAIIKSYLWEHLQDIINKYYDIGDIIQIKKLDRGYVNESFVIDTEKAGKRYKYFLRKYKRGIREEEVKFEHSVIKHLMKKKFTLAASIIKRIDGTTYVKEEKEIDNDIEEIYFAIFEFLEGEDKYTWDNPLCTDKELKSAGKVLAKYHSNVYDVKADGRRYEPKINELLPTISGDLMKYAKRAGSTRFDAYFFKNLDNILSVIDKTLSQIDAENYAKLNQLAVHCDYHPGNLKFKNEEVVGLFDFDWSKIDVRIFDLALAIVYFCSTWEGKDDGDLLLDRVDKFTYTYQDEVTKQNTVGPMNQNEIDYLPVMIKAANLYVLNWDIDDFYIKKQNPYEYLIYLQHNVRLMRWIESNWEKLQAVVKDKTYSSL